MVGLLATNGTIPSASYRNAFSPPIQSSTTIRPALVSVTPALSIRDASSNSFSTPMFVSPLEHDLAVGEGTLVVFLPNAVDKVLHVLLRLLVHDDHRDAV